MPRSQPGALEAIVVIGAFIAAACGQQPGMSPSSSPPQSAAASIQAVPVADPSRLAGPILWIINGTAGPLTVYAVPWPSGEEPKHPSVREELLPVVRWWPIRVTVAPCTTMPVSLLDPPVDFVVLAERRLVAKGYGWTPGGDAVIIVERLNNVRSAADLQEAARFRVSCEG